MRAGRARRQDQRRVAERRARIHVRAVIEQERKPLIVIRRSHQRGRAGAIGGIHISTFVNQEPHGREITIDGGEDQRRVASGIPGVRREATIQRLAELGGGCTLPCGALAAIDGNEVVLDALLAAPDGHIVLRTRVAGSNPAEVGTAAARDVLDGKGGRGMLS